MEKENNNRFKKIKSLIEELIEPSINKIKKFRGRTYTPHKDIEKILKIFFPKTKDYDSKKGFFKKVYVIHSKSRKLVLKEGKPKNIGKDYTTYKSIPKNIRNRYFAKIYWRSSDGKFILQKYGREVKISKAELVRLKEIGKKHGLKDIKEANIMKFGNKLKIIDAERI